MSARKSTEITVYHPLAKDGKVKPSTERGNVRRQGEIWVRVKLLRVAAQASIGMRPTADLPGEVHRLAMLLPEKFIIVVQASWLFGRASLRDIAELAEEYFLTRGDLSGPGQGYGMSVERLGVALDTIWAHRMYHPVMRIIHAEGERRKAVAK